MLARFLGTTRNIENVHTSCFFTPSVSCVSLQSKVKKNQVAVQCYLFLSAFSVCFSIEVFDVNTSLKSDRHMGYQDGNGDVTFAG